MAAVWVRSGGRFYLDLESEFLEAADVTVGDLGGVSAIEVVGAEVVVLDAIAVVATAPPAAQKWAVIWVAALSAGVEGWSIVDTEAVSVRQAASESTAMKLTPDESASHSRRHSLGSRPSALSACTRACNGWRRRR